MLASPASKLSDHPDDAQEKHKSEWRNLVLGIIGVCGNRRWLPGSLTASLGLWAFPGNNFTTFTPELPQAVAFGLACLTERAYPVRSAASFRRSHLLFRIRLPLQRSETERRGSSSSKEGIFRLKMSMAVLEVYKFCRYRSIQSNYIAWVYLRCPKPHMDYFHLGSQSCKPVPYKALWITNLSSSSSPSRACILAFRI